MSLKEIKGIRLIMELNNRSFYAGLYVSIAEDRYGITWHPTVETDEHGCKWYRLADCKLYRGHKYLGVCSDFIELPTATSDGVKKEGL